MTLQQTSNFYNKNNNISQIYKIIEEKQIKQLDFKIVNTWGSLYHMSVPIQSISNNLLEHGLPFDGSSVSGFSDDLNLSDCRMKPDRNTLNLRDSHIPMNSRNILDVK